MKTLALAFLSVALSLLPAHAQSGPVGIGFVQAEEGTWWCRSADSAKGFACAREKCRAAAGGQECHDMRWCGLAAWSGMMIIWLPEFHSTSIICGAPSEAAATAALKALCDNDEVVTRCEVTVIIDPEGKERLVEGLSWPGPTATEMAPDESGEPPANPDPPADARPSVE